MQHRRLCMRTQQIANGNVRVESKFPIESWDAKISHDSWLKMSPAVALMSSWEVVDNVWYRMFLIRRQIRLTIGPVRQVMAAIWSVIGLSIRHNVNWITQLSGIMMNSCSSTRKALTTFSVKLALESIVDWEQFSNSKFIFRRRFCQWSFEVWSWARYWTERDAIFDEYDWKSAQNIETKQQWICAGRWRRHDRSSASQRLRTPRSIRSGCYGRCSQAYTRDNEVRIERFFTVFH